MEVDKHDHRVFHCFVTEYASEILAQVDEAMESIHRKLFRQISPEQMTQFLEIAQVINRNIIEELG